MNRIAELRKQNKLTQEKFSKIIGIGRSTLAMYETNKTEPDFNTLKKMADYFQVSIDCILGYEEKNEGKKGHTNILTKKLKELRGELSQEKYAKIFGLTQRTYSNYETGIREPDIETLIKIANYHNISVDYLIGHDNAIMKRPYSEIAENFIKEFQELFSEERFIKIARTYKKLDDKQRDAFLLAILMYAGGTGIKMA